MRSLLNPWALAGGLAFMIGLLSAAFVAGAQYQSGRSLKPAIAMIEKERVYWVSREINLWQELFHSRGQFLQVSKMIEDFSAASDEARAEMAAEITRAAKSAETWRRKAESNISELRKFKNDWGKGRIPDDVSCGVFNGAGCPDSNATADAGNHTLVDVREPAAGERSH